MTLQTLAMLALLAVLAGAVIGTQAGRPQEAFAEVALVEPTRVYKTTDQPPEPSLTETPLEATSEPTPEPTPVPDPLVPRIIPDTGDPFVWGARVWHEEGFPKRVWFTKQGRAGELAADLVVLLRGETLEFGEGLYELTGMIQVDETGVWAAFLPSDLTLITSTGFNATTGEWKYRVVFLFQEVRRNGNES